jgi:hypothetical protein
VEKHAGEEQKLGKGVESMEGIRDSKKSSARAADLVV